MTSTPVRPAGALFGIDLAGLFNDDEGASGGLNPFLNLMQQTKGRGGALSMRPQPQTGTTAMLGFGGGGFGSIQNIVGSNIGENTGVANINTDIGGDQPTTSPGGPYFTPEAVSFSATPRDYTKDLSRQEAVGKANQLIKRAVGADKLTSQEQYNRLFSPLLKDLQQGDDYGFDIDRFYKNVEKEGFTPYKGIGIAGKLGSTERGQEGAYGDYVNFMFGKDKNFFDQKDAGRRFLEAKAFYRPGGEDTQLDKIGMIQQRFNEGEMKFRGAGGDDYGTTGYRTGTVGGGLKPFYETYMETMGMGSANNQASSQSDSRFKDFDYAAAGESGFGLKDVRSLIDQGATSDEILKVGRRAKDRGLNVGQGVRELFNEFA